MIDFDNILPVSQVKKHLLDIIKNMSEDQSTITVTKNGRPVSVLMTTERYDALMETIEILADPEITGLLAQSAGDFRANRVYKDEEVWND
jgi:prevent-host-death family protein